MRLIKTNKKLSTKSEKRKWIEYLIRDEVCEEESNVLETEVCLFNIDKLDENLREIAKSLEEHGIDNI